MAVLLTPPPIRDPSDTQRWNDWYIRIADILDSINLGDIDVVDTTFRIEDDADETKRAMFECSGITTATTRTFTFPDTDGTLTLNAASQTLTNKTIDANNNTLSNVDAETLDTLDSTQFVRSDTTDVIQNEMRLVYSDPWMYTQFGNASGDTDSRWRVSQYSTSTTPVDQAEFYIDDLTISGALTFTAGDIGSGVADGASAIAFLLNSDNAFSTSGAKLLSLANALTEKFYVDKDGGFVAAAASQIQGNLDMNNNAITSIDWANSDDGSGSSLDADLLDGSQGAAYALLADNEIVTGTWTFNNTISGSIDGDAGTVDGYEGAELAVLAENETVSGAWTFSSTSGLTLNSSAPLIRFDESDQAADNQVWYFRPVAGQLRLEAVNDAETVATAAITIDRTGTTVDAIDFNADLDMNNNALLQIDWANSDDGAGSSLDADLLDGAEGSSYLRSDQDDSTSGALSIKGLTITEYSGDADITGLISGSTFGTLFEGDANAHVVIGIRGNDSNDGFHVIKDDTNDGTYDTILLECDTNVFEYKGNTVWTAASDGAGSGLDADTVDGYEGAELGVLAESETVTGTWQFQSVTNMYQSGGAAKDYLHLRDTTDTIDLVVRYDGANWEFRTESGGAGTQSMEITAGGDVRLTNVDWANSDDGAGSGLDADTVDGNEASVFAVSGGAEHDGFSDFVANEHINHTLVTLTAGTGLSGGGDISANRSFALDLNELGTETTIAAGDFLAMVDITDSGSQKITFSNLESSLNHDSLTGFVANEHIDHTSVTLTAGTGLSGGGDISANRSFAVDLNELGTETAIAAADFIAMVDATDSGSQKITFANFEGDLNHDNLSGFVSNEHINHGSVSITAGNGLTGGGTIAATRTLNVGAGTGISVAADSVGVDGVLQDLDTLGAAAADGEIIVATGAGAFEYQNLGWEIIDSGSESNVSSLELLNLSATYRAYLLVFNDLLPADDAAEFFIRTSSDNGSTWDTGASDYNASRTENASNSNGTTVSRITVISDQGNTVDIDLGSGWIMIHDPMDSGHRTGINHFSYSLSSTPTPQIIHGGGYRGANEANDAIQFRYAGTTNITTMQWTLYGLRAS